MQGTRKDRLDGSLPQDGEYGLGSDRRWHGMTPNGHLAGLALHQVEEHEDGTITVSPSILVKAGRGEEVWHGFLRKGVWEPCGHYYRAEEPPLP